MDIETLKEMLNLLRENHRKAENTATYFYEQAEFARSMEWSDVDRYERSWENAHNYARGIFDAMKLIESQLEELLVKRKGN